MESMHVVIPRMLDFATIYPSITARCFQLVQEQQITEQSITSLVVTMNKAYSFVRDLDELPSKMKSLENVIDRILQQTAECAFFIRAYISRHYVGMRSKSPTVGLILIV